MNKTDPIQILDEQMAVLTRLQALLAEEKNAIKARDADKVTELSLQKAELVESLQRNDTILSPLLQSQTLSQDVKDKKEAIKQLLTTCKQDNEINGKAIHLSLASLARLQQQLSKQLGGDNLTYDDSGKTSSAATRGTSLKA